MKHKLRITFIAATLTVCSIVVFQLYWLYNSCLIARQSFHTTAVNALEKSMQSYQLQQIELPTSLNAKVPTLTVFMRTLPDQDAVALDTPKSTQLFTAKFSTVAIDTPNVHLVKALMARLMLQQLHKPINLKVLTVLYRKELLKIGLDVPVILHLRRKSGNMLPGEIATRIEFYKSPAVLYAEIKEQEWLVKHNLVTALVSLALILLSAGSLWYMGVIIKRQLKLDQLKNNFINNMTHELRTPMAILRSSNEAIAHFGVAGNPEKLARYTGINTTILDKLENEVERILDISRIELGQPNADYVLTEIKQLLHGVTQQFGLRSGIAPAFRCDSALKLIRTDPHKIEIILSNLLDNALKYAGETAAVSINATALSAAWQLQVRDTGVGISNEHLPFIFDKFYRVHTGDLHDVKGYGLGLNHVQQLVKTLHGKIQVSSKPGKGTIFTIILPIL